MIEYFQTIIFRLGLSRSPRTWARQPNAIRLVIVFSVFGAWHSRSLSASQPVLSPAKRFDSAIAEGKKQSDAGLFSAALAAFGRAERIAREANDADRQAIALIWSGNCEIHLFQYRAAVESFAAAQQLATQINDRVHAGIAALNTAIVYNELGDFALAERKQRQAIQYLQGGARKDALARAWLDYGSIQMEEGQITEGKRSFDQAIAGARSANLPAIEALAWDERGTLLLGSNISGAEQALNKGYSLREGLHDKDTLAMSLEHRAELELKKSEYALALKDLDEAFSSGGPLFKAARQYYLIHLRAQILLGLGRKAEALTEFRRAVDSATTWRESAMPGDASSTQTVAYLHDIYQDYAELAAEMALDRHNQNLSRQALEALAENRAASLREQLTVAFSRNSALPPRYYELLSQLQATQARVTLEGNTTQDRAKLQDIRLELYNFEDQIGLRNENINSRKEKNSLQNSLRGIQLRLGPNEALLSFCLGKGKSFLWAVTGNDVNLYQLPATEEIAAEAKTFANAAEHGQNFNPAALCLSRTLFGKLPPAIWQKRDWLLTLDGALLNGVPFAALPDLTASGQALIANHTLRSLPSELLLLSPENVTPQNRFLGIADPIYNLADSRRAQNVSFVPAANGRSTTALARLAGSDREVKTAAKQSGLSDVELLTGGQATTESLRTALAKTPEVLHFAVHIVSPDGQPGEAALALSLTKDNIPELLTREAVATYRVPGSLVVLSACYSQQGRTLPSVGLIGLSRAWLLAGAEAVIVSAWPTADDSGSFFSSFYSHLQTMKAGSLSSRAATALQQAQLDMQRSNGYRSSPSFWAAYSIVSKE